MWPSARVIITRTTEKTSVNNSITLYFHSNHLKQLAVFSEWINTVSICLPRGYCNFHPVKLWHVQITMMVVDSEQALSSLM